MAAAARDPSHHLRPHPRTHLRHCPAGPAARDPSPPEREQVRAAGLAADRTADSYFFLAVVLGIRHMLSITDFFMIAASASAFWAKSTRVR
ncbi:hypothetical protein EV650_1907 [Kribbella kalugense]|uniref:Uncharacterized protein n=1 Tax=Kribbella kalugense TaxID=2512221 RepID=A0A4R7ZXZ7_9ACTN|nr:hypothetical protein EV650_1907 [Kribbella kalugense]